MSEPPKPKIYDCADFKVEPCSDPPENAKSSNASKLFGKKKGGMIVCIDNEKPRKFKDDISGGLRWEHRCYFRQQDTSKAWFTTTIQTHSELSLTARMWYGLLSPDPSDGITVQVGSNSFYHKVHSSLQFSNVPFPFTAHHLDSLFNSSLHNQNRQHPSMHVLEQCIAKLGCETRAKNERAAEGKVKDESVRITAGPHSSASESQLHVTVKLPPSVAPLQVHILLFNLKRKGGAVHNGNSPLIMGRDLLVVDRNHGARTGDKKWKKDRPPVWMSLDNFRSLEKEGEKLRELVPLMQTGR